MADDTESANDFGGLAPKLGMTLRGGYSFPAREVIAHMAGQEVEDA